MSNNPYFNGYLEQLKEHLYADHGFTRGHWGVVTMPYTTHRISHEDRIGNADHDAAILRPIAGVKP